MNKELYIKNEKQKLTLKNINTLVYTLEKFLEESNNKFKKEESIEALKKVKKYLELKKQELKETENIQKNIYHELYTTCNHEVAIKYSNIPSYRCLICECALTRESIDIPKQSLISIDTTNDYKVAYIIEELFQKIIYSDKDLIETITEFLEEIQYERNIKIYRRSK